MVYQAMCFPKKSSLNSILAYLFVTIVEHLSSLALSYDHLLPDYIIMKFFYH